MFDLLDDHLALTPATAQQRAEVMARGMRLRRRRRSLQLGVTALAVLLVAGLFTVFAPRLTRATPQPATPHGEGAWIAYERDGSIHLTHDDGSNDHPILAGDAWYESFPDWSPDGSRLLVTSTYSPSEEKVRIVVVDADGRHPRALVDCLYCGDVAGTWSPDGRTVAYVAPSSWRQWPPAARLVRTVDVATGSTRTVARVPWQLGHIDRLRWSPDGTSLVFAVRGPLSIPRGFVEPVRLSRIAITDVPTTGTGRVRVITDPDLRATDPDWSPDGSHIVFAANPLDRSGGDLDSRWCGFGCSAQNLYTMNPDGSQVTAITHFVGQGALGFYDTFMSAERPRWAADGNRVFFTVREICLGDPACPSTGSGSARAIQAAFVDADGSGLELLPMAGMRNPALRPTTDD